MARPIQVDNLSAAINNELKLYSSEVVAGMKKANDKCMKEFVEDTKRDAPRGRRQKYYKNITSKTTLDTPNRKVNTWYVKDPEYRLTHLIKNGHVTRKGGRTKKNDFIDKNYEKLEKDFEKEVKEVIQNGH
jgi:hypothetical protein